MSTTILIVDDDKEIAELIEVYLRNEGYTILKAHDGEEAQQKMENLSVNLLILDIMMPKMDGMELCRRVRKTSDIPILMLSAKAEDMDKILGLMTGADDYMIKPFNPLELTARVKALMRRANYQQAVETKGNSIYVQSLEINKESHTVLVDGTIVKLTSLEFDILYLLASHRGRVFSSEEIFERVWNEFGGGSNKTVMVHISNLRDKIEAVAPGETFIQTVWGVGYKIEN
ncbi:MAG: response regulator transcription factor [Candidatus Pristimantibacillus lignocellulolyticus]|uniref:Response regulator transcription factor n=1 Tax=Candidatus Pristimantibacillus lignocellulolyticus TaxID=2994561 RepID=A0A9J6ZEK7_9BACL|nr:MAG: response regulator transcription factor [Candidatus Pristimantibacillus lignocellulolyticus]